MPRPDKVSFNPPSEHEREVWCYFCDTRRTYWKSSIDKMKKPYRCKHCAGKIRRKEMEDVIHE